ncbi:hypothetical protein BIW11_09281 [Tropilaelaps mercedesae]|uniref:Uncharacterized protein n=1 Tax=Tropilaelaps mercedesae TaxID=418985 RepID=A0A1V9XL63_9ACAR|nr:hypothetical protein BIW11_09281 [Tropilaelaps mercedesae]
MNGASVNGCTLRVEPSRGRRQGGRFGGRGGGGRGGYRGSGPSSRGGFGGSRGGGGYRGGRDSFGDRSRRGGYGSGGGGRDFGGRRDGGRRDNDRRYRSRSPVSQSETEHFELALYVAHLWTTINQSRGSGRVRETQVETHERLRERAHGNKKDARKECIDIYRRPSAYPSPTASSATHAPSANCNQQPPHCCPRQVPASRPAGGGGGVRTIDSTNQTPSSSVASVTAAGNQPSSQTISAH